jgi:hypothetical protein
MKIFGKLVGLAGLCCAFAALPGTAIASAYEFTSAPTSSDSQLSLGFAFSTNSAVTVTQLGYYDDGGNGFATQHGVGIFDSLGNLLTSTLLSSGTVDGLIGHFRYGAITPFTLAAGQTYTLAATTYGFADPWAYGEAGTTIAGFTVDPSISIAPNSALYTYQSDNILRDPTTHFSNYTIYAGPNFIAANVPEPGTLGILASALAIGWVIRRRR